MNYELLEEIIKQYKAHLENYNQLRIELLDKLEEYLAETRKLQRMGIATKNDKALTKVFECHETLEHATIYAVEIFDCNLAIRYINQARK